MNRILSIRAGNFELGIPILLFVPECGRVAVTPVRMSSSRMMVVCPTSTPSFIHLGIARDRSRYCGVRDECYSRAMSA